MHSLIPAAHVLLSSDASCKRALIAEMVDYLPAMDVDVVLNVIMAREQLGSTGIGHGVAIPHGRLQALKVPVLAFARHARGVDFDAIDDAPVHMIILLLVPDNDDRAHLELLAKLARSLQRKAFRDALMSADSALEVSNLFSEESMGSL
ncbi:MAG: PTS sugar transporter subunit IIA [Zetaproteobacteria bacterium]|nr:PTS sugar transporter subunit IIA [Zetaproteobacteria bacterium]